MENLEVCIVEDFLNAVECDNYFQHLSKLPFDSMSFFNGRIPRRKVYAFADAGISEYKFSRITIKHHPWPAFMLDLKRAVEQRAGATFNYALISFYPDGRAKIGPHRDDESQLDPSAPIAAVSFGATRKIRFTKEGEHPIDVELRNGSLIIMQPTANREWKHEIPVQAEIQQPRISITFRKMIPERPAKRKRSAEFIEEPTTDSLFGNIKSSNLKTVSTSDCEERTLFRCHLSEDIYLSLEYFKNHLKIHIRKYREKDNVLLPTRTGVTMCEETWYAFFKKFFSFTLKYKSNSFIANNDILVFNLKDRALIQSYRNANFIHLNELQIIHLIDHIHTLNDYLLNFKFNERLPQILRECTVILPSLTSEEEMNLTSKLVKCIEQELVTCFQEIFICNACQFFTTQSQEKHNCVTQSSLEKYRYLGENILMLLKFDHTILEFANVHVSERFLGNICFDFLKELLFQ